MNWSDERYVRIYTRDTLTWKRIGWEGQALLVLTLRKLDRAGVLDIDGAGAEGLAVMTGVPLEVVERALPVLLSAGCLELRDKCIIAPNFIEAQEATKSPTARQAESRANRRDLIRAGLDPDKRDAQIYFVQSEHGGPIKIGRAEDLAKRLMGLQTSRPDKLVTLASAKGTIETEKAIHTAFSVEREKGEWFTATPRLMSFIKYVESHGTDALNNVTEFVTSHATGHEMRPVTPSLAVPYLAVPSQPKEEESESAQDRLRRVWNDHKTEKMPEWRRSKHRDVAARERLKERPLDEWVAIIQRIAKSSFCNGVSERGWVADPEFLLRPGTAAKVLEGKYDGGGLQGDWRSRVDHSKDFFAGVDT